MLSRPRGGADSIDVNDLGHVVAVVHAGSGAGGPRAIGHGFGAVWGLDNIESVQRPRSVSARERGCNRHQERF